MSGRVEGRVVVVTGAGRGVGAAAVAALAAEGATVVGCDLEHEGAEARPLVHRRRLHVADADAWAAFAAWLGETFGRVDGLINNAGEPGSTGPRGP